MMKRLVALVLSLLPISSAVFTAKAYAQTKPAEGGKGNSDGVGTAGSVSAN